MSFSTHFVEELLWAFVDLFFLHHRNAFLSLECFQLCQESIEHFFRRFVLVFYFEKQFDKSRLQARLHLYLIMVISKVIN